MLGARKVCSVLTGFALLFQTLFLPLPGHAQTSKKSLVRVCVPLDLVKNEFWGYPYPGSEMDLFMRLVGSYIHDHGDSRLQYRIKDQAFEIFKQARRASAPYTPDPRSLLEEASAEQSCPPTHVVNTLEASPIESKPNSKDPAANMAPVVGALAALALAQTLAQKDDVALKCNQLAASPDDPVKSGPGVPFDQINVREALPICEQAATRQPPQARYQFLYGRVLEAANRYEGEGVNWYQKAGDAGYTDGYAAIATHYGRSNPPNYAEAAKWALKAAQAGSALGSLQMGWHYQFGLGLPKDPQKALQWYTTAAQKGSMQGQYLLGLLYFKGEGMRQDLVTAVNLFQQAAQQGYAEAQDQLGNMYLRGRGVVANDQTAFSWFIRAAEAGQVDAQFWVAAMYDKGQGIPQNKSLAVAWYRKAAEHNDPYAMTQLGYHLREGQGVAWSEREAMQWFRNAADIGDADAQTALGWGYMQGLGQDQGQGVQDYRQAFYWLSKAAIQKDAGAAQLNLGVLYEKGWGVDQNLARANELYGQAARSPHPEIANVARSYMNRPVGTTQSSGKDSDALLGLFVLGLGALAIGALLSGPSRSTHAPASTAGTNTDLEESQRRSNEETTQIIQDSIASENAARESAAAERQADRDNWARTQRCGFNANSGCF